MFQLVWTSLSLECRGSTRQISSLRPIFILFSVCWWILRRFLSSIGRFPSRALSISSLYSLTSLSEHCFSSSLTTACQPWSRSGIDPGLFTASTYSPARAARAFPFTVVVPLSAFLGVTCCKICWIKASTASLKAGFRSPCLSTMLQMMPFLTDGMGGLAHSRSGKRLTKDLPKSVSSPDSDERNRVCRYSVGSTSLPLLSVILRLTSRNSHRKWGKNDFLASSDMDSPHWERREVESCEKHLILSRSTF